MTSRIKEVFFDCDGTLVDSEVIAMRVAGEVLLEALQEQDPSIDFDLDQFVQKYAGWHFDNMIQVTEDEFSINVDHQTVSARKTVATLEALRSCNPIFNMDIAMIMLGQRGIDHSLVTSSELDRVGISLEAADLHGFFPEEIRYSAHDTLPTPTHKPAPDIYLHALEQRGRSADEVIAVEDSTSGVRSAVAAGIQTIGFVGATHIPDDKKEEKALSLIENGACIVLQDMDDLPYVLDHLDDPIMLQTILANKRAWISEDFLHDVQQTHGYTPPRKLQL